MNENDKLTGLTNENDKLIGLTNQNDILDWWDVFPQIKDKKTKDKMAEKAAKQNNSESFEQKLWKTADKLRKNIDAAEYKHIVLGLIFLKYISDAFEELHQKLLAGEGEYEGANPEDPCCGSGGMFVQSEKFIKNHQGRLDDISIYGQESNETTYKLCRMNLAIRGIDGSNIKWNPEGSFLNDAHKDLKADFVIANPPFNDSDWGGDLLRKDGRWLDTNLVPPVGNANFAWVSHFIYHLAPTGSAGFVLSNGSLSSNTSGEGDIRKALVQKDLVDCIVMLPTQLFYNTGIPACLWFLSRYKNGNKNRDRHGEVLFIDASELGYMVNRSSRAFTEAEISKIADTYHEWKKSGGSYRDIKGFCKSANLAEIEKHNFVLTPGRYVGIPDEVEDGVSFEEKMGALTADLAAQMNEGLALDAEIKIQLAKVGFSLEVE